MAKFDVNILKEDPQQFAELREIMLADEKNGNFTHDQDPADPNTYIPVDSNFPFVRKGLRWRWKQWFYGMVVQYYTKRINTELTNLKIVGQENIKGIKSAIITCNHISKVDSFAVRAAVKSDIMYVAGERNNWVGPLGDLARNTGLIPLPDKLERNIMREFNRGIKFYLQKGKKVLFYPEQAMWREYPKPRPLQNGAFHYAVTNNVPVLPMFITLQEKTEKIDSQGRLNFPDYTIHVFPPIYPDPQKSLHENIETMKKTNEKLWRDIYEKTYQTELKY